MRQTKYNKIIAIVFILSTLLLTACTSSKSLTFKVGNSDRIKITLDTSDDYSIKSYEDILYVMDGSEVRVLELGFTTNESIYDIIEQAQNPDKYNLKELEVLEKTNSQGLKYYYITGNIEGVNALFYVPIEGASYGVRGINVQTGDVVRCLRAFDRINVELDK